VCTYVDTIAATSLLQPKLLCECVVFAMNRQAAMKAMMQRKILPAALAIGKKEKETLG